MFSSLTIARATKVPARPNAGHEARPAVGVQRTLVAAACGHGSKHQPHISKRYAIIPITASAVTTSAHEVPTSIALPPLLPRAVLKLTHGLKLSAHRNRLPVRCWHRTFERKLLAIHTAQCQDFRQRPQRHHSPWLKP
jgi:hypothetical protein